MLDERRAQLYPGGVAASVQPVSTRFGAVRDASVCPRDRMVQAYVGCYGEKPERRAKAIIDIGWNREPHGQR